MLEAPAHGRDQTLTEGFASTSCETRGDTDDRRDDLGFAIAARSDMTDERRPNPLVFLSSTVRGLADARRELYAFGQRFGANAVWVDEEYRENLPGRGNRRGTHERLGDFELNPFDDIDDYLYELRRSKLLVVLVGTERVGSSIGVQSGGHALATFFEMELAFAAALGRPIALVSIAGVRPDAKLAYLLDVVARTLNVREYTATSPDDAVRIIGGIIGDVANGQYDNDATSPQQYGVFLADRWRLRERDLSWMSKDWPQFADHPYPDARVVQECMDQSQTVKSEGRRLARLWVGMRELMCAPYWMAEGIAWRDQWDWFLKAWNSAGAWYGLHGHLELGYLAALNSLGDIRSIARNKDKRLLDDPAWDPPFSSQASAYYALARRVSSRSLRWRGLLKAYRLLQKAVYRDPISQSNILAIKGSVLLALGVPTGVLTYRQVLRIREKANAPTGAIGEAMSELGYGYARMGLRSKGVGLLRDGIALMEQAGYRGGFIVRAQYKLADVYSRIGNESMAETARKDALRLAQEHSVGTAARDYSDPNWRSTRA